MSLLSPPVLGLITLALVVVTKRAIPTIVASLLTIGVLLWLRSTGDATFTYFVAFIFLMSLVTGRTKRTSVKGSLCLVTGASSGLGEAIALQCAKAGAKGVIIVARRKNRLEELAKRIKAKYPSCATHVYACDLTVVDDVRKFVESVKADVGVPDILVNNAGAGDWKHIEDETPESGLFTIKIPYVAAFTLTNLFAKDFIKRNSGHIVNITSAASLTAIRGAVGYGVSRWAMRAFNAYLRADLGEFDIGVTLVCALEIDGTEYFETNPEAKSHIPYLFAKERPWSSTTAITTEDVAAGLTYGVEWGRREVYIPGMLHGLVVLERLMPQAFEAIGTFKSAIRKNKAN